MEIRVHPVLLILLLAAVAIAAAVIGLPRLRGGALTPGASAVPTTTAAVTRAPSSGLITAKRAVLRVCVLT